jgi:hypothetical protein
VLVPEEIRVRREHVRSWQRALVVSDRFRVRERRLRQRRFVVEDPVQRRSNKVIGINKKNLAPLRHLKKSQLSQHIRPARRARVHPVCIQAVDDADDRAVFLEPRAFALRNVFGAQHDERDRGVRAGAAGVQELVGEDAAAEIVAVFVVDFVLGVVEVLGVGVGCEEGCESDLGGL